MKSLLVNGVIAAAAMTQMMAPARAVYQLPMRLSTLRNSPDYHPHLLRKVGVRFNGIERDKDVVEYDVASGTMTVYVMGSDGRPLKGKNGSWQTEKLQGTIEPYWKGLAPVVPVEVPSVASDVLQNAAAAKRARKAARLIELADKGAIAKVVPPAPAKPAPKARKPRAKKVAVS